MAWLHGYTMDSSLWEPLWQQLPGQRHVGIDLPGHGSAADQPVPGSLAGLADLVAARLQADGCRSLVGLSFGSCVALQVALDHPHLLDRVVLAAPTLAGPADDPEARDRYLEMYQLYQRSGPGPELTAVWMAEPPAIFTGLRRYPDTYDLVRRTVERHLFTELGTGAMRMVTQTVHTPALLAGIAVPLLVVAGAADMPQFRDNARLLEAVVPDCTVHVVPGAGHLPLLEQPSACSAVLDRFLPAAPGADQP
ncbi:MAG TPA: alpha/beta hydrolase [Mycobacteriales bacterium]|nr:alpha/beta hydrolase [Mycobacteriales bacterium]